MDCERCVAGSAAEARQSAYGLRPAAAKALSSAWRRLSAWRRRSVRPGCRRVVLLVAAAFCVVHAGGPALRAGAGENEARPGVTLERAYHGTLPQSVVDMREQILAAVHAGELAELKDAIEWNEIKPDFGAGSDDPIA